MRNNKFKKTRKPNRLLIIAPITNPHKHSSDLKNICLLDHINQNRGEPYNQKKAHKQKLQCIENRVGRLRNDKTAVHRENNSQNKDEIYSDRNNKNRHSKRKHATSCSQIRILKEQNGK